MNRDVLELEGNSPTPLLHPHWKNREQNFSVDHLALRRLYREKVQSQMRKLVKDLDRNWLNNKAARYESHKQFLENCIQEKLIPEGLRLQLEPTIGNYDDEFLHNWYVKLEKFSLELMTDVVDFCDKTLVSTGKSIIETEAELKTKIEAKEFASVRETIALNKEETSKALQIRKKRKYRNLKYR